MEKNILDIVREMEDNDYLGNTKISKYVNFSLRENIDKIDAYVNSKHTSGSTDSKGREKPFFNIVNAARNIWYRATDQDRKHIRIISSKYAQYAISFIATILLSNWMKKADFGQFLNDWGRTLATYCSAISKHIEKNGELISEVIPWNRIICDPINFDGNPIIEKIWLTPAELRARKEYDKEMVDSLILAQSSRETMDGQKQDSKDNYILIYEVHGELPLSYITEDESDQEIYRQQMHVCSYLAKKESGANGKIQYEDYTLYKGRETQSPYELTHLLKEDGRVMGIGAVENLFDAQWMINHSVKQIKDQLDLASKVIFQTADGNFVGKNVLTSIDNGDILKHAVNMPLTQIANNSNDIASLQSFGSQWKQLSSELNGISEAMLTGETKSGTAWRQTEALLQESHSLFEIMTENKGLALERILRKFVIPHLKKKMDTSEEITALLDEQQIRKLDAMYVPSEAIKMSNKNMIEKILNGYSVSLAEQQEDIAMSEQGIRKGFEMLGSQRFFKPSDITTKTWKTILAAFEWEVDIDITGENKDRNGMLATLTTVMQTLATNPMVLNNPNMKIIFNKILSLTGAISPLEMPEDEPIIQPEVEQAVKQPIPQMAMQ